MSEMEIRPVEYIDYCGTCGMAVAPYVDDVCGCCGRVWGTDRQADGQKPVCQHKHVEGAVWKSVVDSEVN